MKIDENVQQLLEKVNSGELDKYIPELENSDLGFHVPVYCSDGELKLMNEGFSQTESNLKISVVREPVIKSKDNYIVGWMGNLEDKPQQCRGGHSSCTGHCESHSGPTKNCSACEGINSELIAPELDYDSAVQQLKTKTNMLNSIAKDGFGLSLLHGHNSEFTFTKLPHDYVSVISGGETKFRKFADVQVDPTFVPTVWRVLNGKLQVAGGHSDQ